MWQNWRIKRLKMYKFDINVCYVDINDLYFLFANSAYIIYFNIQIFYSIK